MGTAEAQRHWSLAPKAPPRFLETLLLHHSPTQWVECAWRKVTMLHRMWYVIGLLEWSPAHRFPGTVQKHLCWDLLSISQWQKVLEAFPKVPIWEIWSSSGNGIVGGRKSFEASYTNEGHPLGKRSKAGGQLQLLNHLWPTMVTHRVSEGFGKPINTHFDRQALDAADPTQIMNGFVYLCSGARWVGYAKHHFNLGSSEFRQRTNWEEWRESWGKGNQRSLSPGFWHRRNSTSSHYPFTFIQCACGCVLAHACAACGTHVLVRGQPGDLILAIHHMGSRDQISTFPSGPSCSSIFCFLRCHL